ncbi:tetratricopeptide repeat protein 19, mitochondrial [Rhincodon typus]|uniref:tetratricopeptide repeat protein 19, mitochondrial n=1 Tax=Rhincodon typus TaxID=259920 RepID=UPI00202F5E38|nr:tetratricopeptide repeat protein 19, mitochondrial [Rhincodon typus]
MVCFSLALYASSNFVISSKQPVCVCVRQRTIMTPPSKPLDSSRFSGSPFWSKWHPPSPGGINLWCQCQQVSAMTGKLEDADRYLHQALKLAQLSQNNQAITYTYTQMANLAFLRGDLLNAEKLFKAAMSQLLQAGTPEDDNAMIEMSLKLCSIYVTTEQHGLAVEGYKWCIETLEEKVQREKDVPEVSLSAAEKDNTRLLLGMCLDSCARYMTSQKQLVLAESLYEQALAISQQVQGETHPQVVGKSLMVAVSVNKVFGNLHVINGGTEYKSK